MLDERAAKLGATLWDVLEVDPLESFPARATTALRAFRALIHELRAAAEELPLPALLDELLAKTGYTDMFRRDNEEEQAKLENIREFLSAAQNFTESKSYGSGEDEDLLTAFLDHVALVSDLDAWDGERGVSLMTLHSAKGLEFPVIFLPGLEDGLLPHWNSQGKSEDLEEERRLFYVGMTRAKERLHLSCCRRRRIAGRLPGPARIAAPRRGAGEPPRRLPRAPGSTRRSARARSRSSTAGRRPCRRCRPPVRAAPSAAAASAIRPSARAWCSSSRARATTPSSRSSSNAPARRS